MRYARIVDIRELPLYRNINCRVLYLHLVLSAPWQTDQWHTEGVISTGLRTLANEVGMSYQQLRTALAQLEKAGLVSTQGATQSPTQGATQRVTQITIVGINELQGRVNAPSNAMPNAEPNADPNAQIKEYKQEDKHTPGALAPAYASGKVQYLSVELGMSLDVLRGAWRLFAAKCLAEGKQHKDDADQWSHYCSWCRQHRDTLEKDVAKYNDALREQDALREIRARQAEMAAESAAMAERMRHVPTPDGVRTDVWVNWCRMYAAGVGPDDVLAKVPVYLAQLGISADDVLAAVGS